MKKAAYLDLFAGCSGDMLLGAILDAGLPLEQLAESLAGLPLSGYRITQQKVQRATLSSTLATVILEDGSKQSNRDYNNIINLIGISALSSTIKRQAVAVFRNLGEAEAKIHDIPLDKVHFHEVGAIDSIIDIVGTIIGFELLGITRIYSSPFPVSSGYIECGHGVLPLPAPATMELISANNVPVISPVHKAMEGSELVTPTAAAIITSMAEFSRPPLKVEKIAYGAGSRDPRDYPNIMRLWIGDTLEKAAKDAVVLLETNIDDMNPQIYEYVMDKLFKQGALDVWFTPVHMKKNRPAIMLSVLADEHTELCMVETLMRETSTLGVRSRTLSRHIAGREIVELDSSHGKIRVKIKRYCNTIMSIKPEYDDCRKIAEKKGIPLKDVYQSVEQEAREKLYG